MCADIERKAEMFSEADKNWGITRRKKIEAKYAWVADKNRNGIPSTTDENGNYDNRADTGKTWALDNGINWWTNGFWGGILWQLYATTGHKPFAEIAAECEGMLDRCFTEFYGAGLHHDVGFMWLPTAVVNYRMTGSETSYRRAMLAANLLAGRFNPAGQFIRAWNALWDDTDTRGWAIIDCMMNLPLLYWATEETKDPRFRQIAKAHADTTARCFVRPDGSSHHIVEFDPETGAVVSANGGQGYAKGSAWTRGQAWALYGFTVNYACSGHEAYLAVAKDSADYFMGKIPPSGLIPIDFDQPAEPALEDSAAAVIAACGFLKLSLICTGTKGEQYRDAALHILQTLDARRCNYGGNCDAIVSHCSGSYHNQNSHHINMVYADYFYLRALNILCGDLPDFYW